MRNEQSDKMRAEAWGRKAAEAYIQGGDPQCPFISAHMRQAWARGFRDVITDHELDRFVFPARC